MAPIKQLIASLLKPKNIMMIVVVLLLIYVFMQYNNTKSWDARDSMTNPATPAGAGSPEPAAEMVGNKAPVAAGAAGAGATSMTNPSDLLPADSNSDWARLNPATNNDGIVAPDMLIVNSQNFGLDTIGSSRKNANLQIRPDPIIPKQEVGPWNQSTIQPDLLQIPMDLNCGTR